MRTSELRIPRYKDRCFMPGPSDRQQINQIVQSTEQWRGIATRYDKTAESYQAAVALASLLMWV